MNKKIRFSFFVTILTASLFTALFAFYSQLKIFYGEQSLSQVVNQIQSIDEIDIKLLESYNPKSQKSVDALIYQIKIDLYPEKKSINGDVRILMKLNNPGLKSVDLNFYDNMKITSLKVNDQSNEYKHRDKLLTIPFGSMIGDSISIQIKYEGTPRSLGFGSFVFGEGAGKPFIYTLNEPVFASTWFPCIDQPDDKVLTEISITADSNLVSVSNGILNDRKIFKDKSTYTWKTMYPISTYLISFYSADYVQMNDKYISVNGDTVKLSYYSLPDKFADAKKDFEDHPKYLKVFEELFGAYAFPKEKYAVAEILWNMGAMENQTITGVGSNFITGKKFFTDMLIHELAHHWWGNAVGPKTWKDIWLNEGFCTYSEALYWEKVSGLAALQTTINSKKSEFPEGTLYNPGNALFSENVYDKGAWVLHMLRKEIGSDAFFKLLREYYEKYKYGNASTFDFKKLAEKISGKKLDQFFKQWVFEGEGILEIQYEWSSRKNLKGFETDLLIYQLQNGYDIYKFPVDIKIIYEDDSHAVETHFISERNPILKLASTQKPKRIILDPDGWLLADISESK